MSTIPSRLKQNAKEIDDADAELANAHAELAKATKDKIEMQLEMIKIIQDEKELPTERDLEKQLREDILELLNSNDDEMYDLGVEFWTKTFPKEKIPKLKVGGKRRKKRSQKKRSKKRRSQKRRSQKKRSKKR